MKPWLLLAASVCSAANVERPVRTAPTVAPASQAARAASLAPVTLPIYAPAPVPALAATAEFQKSLAADRERAAQAYAAAGDLDGQLRGFFDGVLAKGRDRRLTLADGSRLAVAVVGSGRGSLALERGGYVAALSRDAAGAYSLTTTRGSSKAAVASSTELKGRELLALAVDAERRGGAGFDRIAAVQKDLEAGYRRALADFIAKTKPASRYARLANSPDARVVDASALDREARRLAGLWGFRAGLSRLAGEGRWLVRRSGNDVQAVSLEALGRGELDVLTRSLTYGGGADRFRADGAGRLLEAPSDGGYRAHRAVESFVAGVDSLP